MRKSLHQHVIQLGAVVLGAVLYGFILIFDWVAAVVNAFKQQFRLPQLTDFRRHEENKLHIPVLPDSSEQRIQLKKGSVSLSGDVITYSIPLLESNPKELLLEVGTIQQFEVSTEIELCLFNTEGKRTLHETIFLFIYPFDDLPNLHYPANRLWCTVPTDRILEITCTDVQPDTESVHLSALQITILDCR